MQSNDYFKIAKENIPGGVNSPVRSFNYVGGTPVYIKSGKGALVQTEDGDELIDFCCSWGPLIFGHAKKEIIETIINTSSKGTSFGANTIKEAKLAKVICERIPEIDMLRLVNSGTEAVMASLRLARGYTKKQKILKFDGCYHGHTDQMLISPGSGAIDKNLNQSGISISLIRDTFTVPYNDIIPVKKILDQHHDDIAAVIIEPIAANMGLVKPKNGFLKQLREITEKNNILLIFDEVISGLRLAPTTYGHLNNIKPDLTILGKIIGGGLPLAAIGGKKDIMNCLAPEGSVYQAGTLSGNPIAVAVAIKTMDLIQNEPPYEYINKLGKKLSNGVNQIAKDKKIDMYCCQEGSMFTLFFGNKKVANLEDAKNCDREIFAKYFHHMLSNGFYMPPSPFETSFISSEHNEEHIDLFLEALLSF